MKKAIFVLGMICAIFALLATCASGGGTVSGSNAVRGKAYTGNGGKGVSLAVLVPEGMGLSGTEAYLPSLVQGVFVGDLKKYSAISVLDRLNLEKVLKETESGIYQEGSDFVELGQIAKVDYALTGRVTKTNAGYTLAVNVMDTKTGLTKAAYNGSCSAAEFDNFTGIKKASLELLPQIGVDLTAAAKTELSQAAGIKDIKAETALARGITAQKQGNRVESLAYYYQAVGLNTKLPEARSRLSTMSSAISTGKLGEDLRNDYAWRGEWVKLIEEVRNLERQDEAYFEGIIDSFVELSYSLKVAEIYYQRGIASFDLSYTWSVDNWEPVIAERKSVLTKIASDVNKGLRATGRQKDWGLVDNYLTKNFPDYEIQFINYAADAVIYNDKGVKAEIYQLDYPGIRKKKIEKPFDLDMLTVDTSYYNDDRALTYYGVGLYSNQLGIFSINDIYESNFLFSPSRRKNYTAQYRFYVDAANISDNMVIEISNPRKRVVEDYSKHVTTARVKFGNFIDASGIRIRSK